MTPLDQRTAQDLLAERRVLVNEMRREADEMARAMQTYYIGEIDAELDRRRGHELRTRSIP